MFSENSLILFAQYNHLQSRDLLVATVAIGLGINIFYAVITNNRRCYSLGSVRMMERNFGRVTTQVILFVIGGVCLVLGAHLIIKANSNRKFSDVRRHTANEFDLHIASTVD